MDKSNILPSLEATMAETTYQTFSSLMMEAVTATISDLKSESELNEITAFFERLRFRSLSMFFAPLSIQQTVSELGEMSEVRNFVLSIYQRFTIAVAIAEMRELVQGAKDEVVKISNELHSQSSLFPQAIAFSEMTKTDDLRDMLGCNSWLFVLYLCLALGTFDDAIYQIGQQAVK